MYGATHATNGNDGEANRFTWEAPPLFARISNAAYVYVVKGIFAAFGAQRDLQHAIYGSPAGAPDIVKAYECRPSLLVR